MPTPPAAGAPPPERRCIATVRNGEKAGERCGNWTADERVNVCRFHGGAAFDRETGKWKGGGVVVHGRYARNLVGPMAERIEAHRNDPDLKAVNDEIANARAIYDTLLEKSGEQIGSGKIAPIAVGLLKDIVTMVEKRHKMLHGPNVTITVRDWEVLLTRTLTLTRDYFYDRDPELYERFLREVTGMPQPQLPAVDAESREIAEEVES